MESSRTVEKLFSFAVSSMLTSAVLATAPNPTVVTAAAGLQPSTVMSMIEGARSAGFAGLKDAPAPATIMSPADTVNVKPVAATQTGLTPTQIAKLRKLAIGPDGHDGPIRASLAKGLGLTTGNEVVVLRSFSATDPDTKITFQIFLLPNNAGYVIGRSDTVTVRFFKLDAALNLQAAVTGPTTADTATPIPAPDAQKLCDADKATMGEIADALGMA